MIENFDKFNGKSVSYFRSIVSSCIEDLLALINLDNLSEQSQIEITKNRSTILLVHKKDPDSAILLNILDDYVTLWYSECEIRFEKEDIDLNYFKEIYFQCLVGEYETIDLYFKEKLLSSSTRLLEREIKGCTLAKTLFYKIYVWLYKKKLTTKKIQYKSFIDPSNIQDM